MPPTRSPFAEPTVPHVLGLLAHRYPFLLLDRITALEPGRRAEGLKRVTAGEWFLRDAAPAGRPRR